MTNSPDLRSTPATGAMPWRPLEPGDSEEFSRARNEALNIVQWLARIAHSYVIGGASEQRTDLDFDAAGAWFTTQSFADGTSLQMRLPDLHLQFLANGEPVPHIFDPDGRSPAEVEAWILVELLHRGIDREKFSKELPYAIAGLMSGDAVDHETQACREGLTQLAAWFGNAATVLEAVARAAGAMNARILCLPQTLALTLAPDSGRPRIDLGFSPGDRENPEPYFYARGIAGDGSQPTKRIAAAALLTQGDPAQAAATLSKIAAG
ncbi:MAG TPA: hypothetical protein VF778_02720 [Xanthobacteraceae bacterium]